MSDEKQESLSLDEADIILNSQVEMFKHVRNRMQRLLRLLLVFLGICVTGLSIVVSLSLTGDIRTNWWNFVISNSGLSKQAIAVVLYFQQWVIIGLVVSIISAVLSSVHSVTLVLSGPGLKPGLGNKNSLPIFPEIPQLNEDSTDSTTEKEDSKEWTKDYQEWISYNASKLDYLRKREKDAYKRLTFAGFLIGALFFVFYSLLMGSLGNILTGEVAIIVMLYSFYKFMPRYSDKKALAIVFGTTTICVASLQIILYFIL